MYAIDRKVYIKSLGYVGVVTERNYVGNPRKAHYIIFYTDELGGHSDYLTGSDDLEAADFCCDGCNHWRSNNRRALTVNEPDGGTLDFCFLCVKAGDRETHRRLVSDLMNYEMGGNDER